jgi:hypothetical protein
MLDPMKCIAKVAQDEIKWRIQDKQQILSIKP